MPVVYCLEYDIRTFTVTIMPVKIDGALTNDLIDYNMACYPPRALYNTLDEAKMRAEIIKLYSTRPIDIIIEDLEDIEDIDNNE